MNEENNYKPIFNMDMNWKLYYERIKTQEDYDKIVATGMAWEIFPDLPNSFQEGQEFYKEWKWANE